MSLEWKQCPNCNESHHGQFEDCYQCFDCETEVEYEERKQIAILRRKVEDDLAMNRAKHKELWNY